MEKHPEKRNDQVQTNITRVPTTATLPGSSPSPRFLWGERYYIQENYPGPTYTLQHNKIPPSTKTKQPKNPLPGPNTWTRVGNPTLHNHIYNPQNTQSNHILTLPNPGKTFLPGFNSNPRKPRSHKHFLKPFQTKIWIKTQALIVIHIQIHIHGQEHQEYSNKILN